MSLGYDPDQLKSYLADAQQCAVNAEEERLSRSGDAATAIASVSFSGYRYPDGIPAPRPRADIPYPEGHMYINEKQQ